MNVLIYKTKLTEKGLKVTPQRLAVLEAVSALKNHPTAVNIIEHIRRLHPNVATGTVYKVLDLLEEKKLITKVKTDDNIMRYDDILEQHHHLYCKKSGKIKDYWNEELDKLIYNYFYNKKIENFKIEEIKLQINGNFID